MTNYDGSKVGVPYVRVSRIIIEHPDDGQPQTAYIAQTLAVRLADGTVRQLDDLGGFTCALDFTKGDEPIALIHPETSEPLGTTTTLNRVFLGVLAVVRLEQNKAELAKQAALDAAKPAA